MRTRRRRILDGSLLVLGIVAIVVLVTRYGMPFRMDDVLYMQWAIHHPFTDSFSTTAGELFMSFRPVMAMTFWLLTHLAGPDRYWIWHTLLVGAYFTAIAFTGLTARYICERISALPISAVAYWLAFLPILNVLFWFADLTYALEMMFCSAAWYFGIRALDEFRTSFWVTANIIGVIAVMTKEPSLLLIHGVFLGMVIFRRRRIQRGLKPLSTNGRILWAASYGLFALVSLVMFFSSNATSTRFFHFGEIPRETLHFLMMDRLRYYSDTLATTPFVVFVSLGIVGLIVADSARTVRKSAVIATIFSVLILVCWVVYKPLLLLTILLAAPLFAIQGGNRGSRRVLIVPFGAIAIVNSLVLLITMMLVKTQLAELSFLLTLIASVGVASLVGVISERLLVTSSLRIGATIGIVIAAIGATIFLLPKLRSKEALLCDVRSSRLHANQAIRLMAHQLPQSSTVAVTTPALIGLRSEDELTSTSDDYKVYAQHSFQQGFVRAYFQVLGRPDLHLAYLADSTTLPRTLDSLRSARDHYLFLETGLDVDLAHGKRNGRNWFNGRDSLLARFDDGGFASEVWKLR
ncbi:MAG: hypothetical protein JSS75_08215 [Bacteroidetes bacterium]|nr:hypothetical protein [Bacteroidota bacterium]